MSDAAKAAPAVHPMVAVVAAKPSFFSEIASWFEDKVQEAEIEVKAVAHALIPALEGAAENAIETVENGAAQIAQIAWSAVIAEIPAVYSGAEKFSTAVTSVIQEVVAKGMSVEESTAQAAVQGAYLTLQKAAADAVAAIGKAL